MPFVKGHKVNVGKSVSKETRLKISIGNLKPKIEVSCEYCKKIFSVIPSIVKHGKGKFCSKKCSDKSRIGVSTWNKGLKGFRAGEKRPGIVPCGEKNTAWKGDDVLYRAMHSWVERKLGCPNLCADCGRSKPPMGRGIKRSYFQWANISREYKRDVTDWKRLCYKCHKTFDKKN